jgi:DNA-directed RNA polymerase subunit RPC12/RpoP
MRYSDNIVCDNCQKPMRGKGLERDEQGAEYIACEYCSTRYEVVRRQQRPGGRVKIVSGARLPS